MGVSQIEIMYILNVNKLFLKRFLQQPPPLSLGEAPQLPALGAGGEIYIRNLMSSLNDTYKRYIGVSVP